MTIGRLLGVESSIAYASSTYMRVFVVVCVVEYYVEHEVFSRAATTNRKTIKPAGQCDRFR